MGCKIGEPYYLHLSNKRISRTEKPEGKSYIFEHYETSPSDEQLCAYANIIRSLRDLSYECFVISFIDTDDDKLGLAFYQMYAIGNGLLHVEVGIETAAGPELYGKECGVEEAIEIMNEVSKSRKAPDVSKWQDMTQDVFGEEEKRRREEKEQAEREAERINDIGWDIHQGLTSGVPDPDAAIPYYEQAAAMGSSVAMVNLGNIYEDREDYKQAYYWYNEAALAGNETGAYNVANMYHWGWHVKHDYKKAYEYFKMLYSRYYRGAAFYMGLYSEYGYVGKTDYKAALEYYREGLDSGDGYCAVNLGRMYCLGLGVEKDVRKGFEYYLQGYEADDPLACANLGYCYETGQGVEQDEKEALRYYREGADMGDENCIAALSRLEGESSNE